MSMDEKKPGNKQGQRLMVKALPSNTVRKLLLSQLPPGTQLSSEAVETARAFWQNTIKDWAKNFLLNELETSNTNPNRTKPSAYKYRRITGLMTQRALLKYKEGRE